MTRRKLTKALSLLLILCFLPSCYLSSQAWTQAKLLNRREPISEVIDRPDVDAVVKEKLRFTKRVLEFAEGERLRVEDSYSHFVKLDGPAVSYLVQAAKPDEFELKTWWFPIVGTVPYLGFFDRADRDQYADELERDGYEVYKPAATAFSSLGWFSDPVYSSMLTDSDADLAHLYFHELTHKTAWIKGSVQFNENFAEFVGEAMTVRFFKQLQRPRDLDDWNIRRKDRETFKLWLKQLKEELERYFVDSKRESDQDLVAAKRSIIAKHVANKPDFVKFDFVGTKEWNTPRILGASLYSPDTAKFHAAFTCSGLQTLGEFAAAVKKKLEHADNPDEGLATFCSQK